MASWLEKPFSYRRDANGFGVLTEPVANGGSSSDLPVLILFNAGLLHRSEPFGLNRDLARALAGQGVTTVRFDLSIKGDTDERPGLTNQESVALDWSELSASLGALIGERALVLGGLCSGSDNATRTAIDHESVIGTVLLDPICPRAPSFGSVRWKQAIRDPLEHLRRLRRDRSSQAVIRDLRDEPTEAQRRAMVSAMKARGGQICAVFTSYSDSYYNRPGQYLETLNGVDSCPIEEHFRPDARHLYPLLEQRRWLIGVIGRWFKGFAARA